jgi:integrase
MHIASSDIRLRKITDPEGRVRPYLVRDGIPLVLPNLWIDEVSSSAGPNTADAYLRDIALVYRWAATDGCVLEDRLRRLQGFSSREIYAVAEELCRTRLKKKASRATCTRRFESVKSFLRYCFDFFIEINRLSLSDQAQAEKNYTKQIMSLRRLIRRHINSAQFGSVSTELSNSDLAVIESIIDPDSTKNPFKSRNIKIRNYCLFHVAIEILARRGELVLLEVEDVNAFGDPTITIKPPSVNNKFKRLDGASLKTRGRMVPITNKLARNLREYLDIVRPQFLIPRRPAKALFLSARDGRRLSSYTINQIIKTIASHPDVVEMEKRLHPHALRVAGANLVRDKITAAGKSSGMEIVDALSYLGGWAQDSNMVAKYSRASISERLGFILRGGKSGSDNDQDN